MRMNTEQVCRGIGDGMFAEGVLWQHGKSRAVDGRMPDQPEAREGKTGLHGMAERPVLPRKPGNAGGGKGPWFKGDAGRGEGEEIGVSLRTPESVWKLQGALHAKAKGEPSYRFYSLYDKIHRKDVLLHAWNCCRANGGAAGVDGQSFEQIEAWGLEGWLGELAEEIRKKTYRAQAVRRVWIPKPDGKQRPLGIPTPPLPTSPAIGQKMCAVRTTTRRLAEAFPILRDMLPRDQSFSPELRQDAQRKSQFAGIDLVSVTPS